MSHSNKKNQHVHPVLNHPVSITSITPRHSYSLRDGIMELLSQKVLRPDRRDFFLNNSSSSIKHEDEDEEDVGKIIVTGIALSGDTHEPVILVALSTSPALVPLGALRVNEDGTREVPAGVAEQMACVVEVAIEQPNRTAARCRSFVSLLHRPTNSPSSLRLVLNSVVCFSKQQQQPKHEQQQKRNEDDAKKEENLLPSSSVPLSPVCVDEVARSPTMLEVPARSQAEVDMRRIFICGVSVLELAQPTTIASAAASSSAAAGAGVAPVVGNDNQNTNNKVLSPHPVVAAFCVPALYSFVVSATSGFSTGNTTSSSDSSSSDVAVRSVFRGFAPGDYPLCSAVLPSCDTILPPSRCFNSSSSGGVLLGNANVAVGTFRNGAVIFCISCFSSSSSSSASSRHPILVAEPIRALALADGPGTSPVFRITCSSVLFQHQQQQQRGGATTSNSGASSSSSSGAGARGRGALFCARSHLDRCQIEHGPWSPAPTLQRSSTSASSQQQQLSSLQVVAGSWRDVGSLRSWTLGGGVSSSGGSVVGGVGGATDGGGGGAVGCGGNDGATSPDALLPGITAVKPIGKRACVNVAACPGLGVVVASAAQNRWGILHQSGAFECPLYIKNDTNNNTASDDDDDENSDNRKRITATDKKKKNKKKGKNQKQQDASSADETVANLLKRVLSCGVAPLLFSVPITSSGGTTELAGSWIISPGTKHDRLSFGVLVRQTVRGITTAKQHIQPLFFGETESAVPSFVLRKAGNNESLKHDDGDGERDDAVRTTLPQRRGRGSDVGDMSRQQQSNNTNSAVDTAIKNEQQHNRSEDAVIMTGEMSEDELVRQFMESSSSVTHYDGGGGGASTTTATTTPVVKKEDKPSGDGDAAETNSRREGKPSSTTSPQQRKQQQRHDAEDVICVRASAAVPVSGNHSTTSTSTTRTASSGGGDGDSDKTRASFQCRLTVLRYDSRGGSLSSLHILSFQVAFGCAYTNQPRTAGTYLRSVNDSAGRATKKQQGGQQKTKAVAVKKRQQKGVGKGNWVRSKNKQKKVMSSTSSDDFSSSSSSSSSSSCSSSSNGDSSDDSSDFDESSSYCSESSDDIMVNVTV